MKPSVVLLACTLISTTTAPAEILISQSYEGSAGFSKWIELANTSAKGVALDGLALTIWVNSNTENWKTDGGFPEVSIDLTGFSIPANGHFLLAHPNAEFPAYPTADIQSSSLLMNGDDCIVLYDTALGVVGDTAAILDALSFTDAGLEGRDKSVYRVSNGTGFNLTPGSTFLDFPAIWAEKTEAEVDGAVPSDLFYLQQFFSDIDLSVSLSPNTISEDAGPGAVDVTVTRTGSTTGPLDLTLTSSDPSEATIPAPERQIPASQASATFTMAIDGVDDIFEDGTTSVVIGASAPGVNGAGAELLVEDDGDTQDIVINEVLLDPPSGVDVNGDGVVNRTHEQFIELLNKSPGQIDLSSWSIVIDDSARHCFAAGTILDPGCAACVFGGGSTSFLGGSAIYRTATKGGLVPSTVHGMSICIDVVDDNQITVANMIWFIDDSLDQSLTRDDPFAVLVEHESATGSGGTRYSPGTKVDGTEFCPALGTLTCMVDPPIISENGGTCTATITRNGDPSTPLDCIISSVDPTEAVPDLQPPRIVRIPANETSVDVVIKAVDDIAPDGTQNVDIVAKADRYDLGIATIQVEDDDGAFTVLSLNEILADPAGGLAGDANGDGVRSSSNDEFTEWLNLSDGLFDLSGFMIADSQQVRHVFPPGTELLAGQSIVVFGGGNPTGDFGGAVVQTASNNFLSLNNTGDTVRLLDQNGDELTSVEYSFEATDESWVRTNDDGTGDLVTHSSLPESNGSSFSPGTKVDGSEFQVDPNTPTRMVDFHADLQAETVTVTMEGLEVGCIYILRNTITSEFGEGTVDVGSFTIEDGIEVRPGVHQFTLNDPTMALTTKLLYDVFCVPGP